MGAKEKRRIVVTDTNVAINLIKTGRIGMLSGIPGYQFAVTDEVLTEITNKEQAEVLKAAITKGQIGKESLSSVEELKLFSDYSTFLGLGESSCMAIAESRGWLLASDERRTFLRTAEERLGPGRVVTTPGIYVLAIRAGVLMIEDADEDKLKLEKCRFKMKFKSFRDVVGNKQGF